MLFQLLKMDEDTQALLANPLPQEISAISKEAGAPWLFHIDPLEFTHAYMLLGSSPSRFGYDLSLYLTTVNTFFSRTPLQKTILIPAVGSDAKKRLSEDLAVAVASLFMVKGFKVDWHTISQIPLNNKLSKKRPDFEGFSHDGARFIFEVKGTTSAGSVEKALGKAISQVKSYPENALRKLAIVSFFSSDNRMFDSATFVVDPSLPDMIPPDERTSRLLHHEKILQFSGFPQSANQYIKRLASLLREKRAILREEVQAFVIPSRARDQLRIIQEERQNAVPRQYKGKNYLGQVQTMDIGNDKIELFLGINKDYLDITDGSIDIERWPISESYREGDVNVFSDGTVIELTRKIKVKGNN